MIENKGQKLSILRNHINNVVQSRSKGIRIHFPERSKVNVIEMKCLRSLVAVSRMARVRSEEVHMRAGIERELASIGDPSALRWFFHVERMGEYHMAKNVLMAEGSGVRYEVERG